MFSMLKISRVIKLFVIIIFSQSVYSQNITSAELKIKNNTYHINMDSRIASMLSNLEESCHRDIYTEIPNIEVNNMNKAEICKESPKLIGYKIQVAITQNGNDANKIRYEFGQKFPELKVEIDTNIRPNHKILAGSYFSKESGNGDLERVKKVFRSAILVPYRIFCEESI